MAEQYYQNPVGSPYSCYDILRIFTKKNCGCLAKKSERHLRELQFFCVFSSLRKWEVLKRTFNFVMFELKKNLKKCLRELQ